MAALPHLTSPAPAPQHHQGSWHWGATGFTQQYLQQTQGEVAMTPLPPAENQSINHMFPQEGDGNNGQSLKRPPRPPSPHFPLPPASHLTCNTLFTAGHPTRNTPMYCGPPFFPPQPSGPCPRDTALRPGHEEGVVG